MRYANTVRERLCGEIWLALSQQNHMCVIACFQPNDDVNMPKLVKEITSKVNKSGHISSKVSNWRVNKCLANLDQSKSSFRSFLTTHNAPVQQHVTTFAGFPSMLLIEAGISSIWRREVFSFERVVHGMAIELALLPFSEQWL